jgi:hypothetical protein
VQTVPITFLLQMVPLQTNPLAQSALVAHFVRQLAPPQTYGRQLCRLPAPQMFDPLHLPASVAVPAVHEFVPQTVPATYVRQPPAPSHVPSRPQVTAP